MDVWIIDGFLVVLLYMFGIAFQETWKNLHLWTIVVKAVKHTEQQEHVCAIHLGQISLDKNGKNCIYSPRSPNCFLFFFWSKHFIQNPEMYKLWMQNLTCPSRFF